MKHLTAIETDMGAVYIDRSKISFIDSTIGLPDDARFNVNVDGQLMDIRCRDGHHAAKIKSQLLEPLQDK